jgi:hypothetical protein
MHGSIIHCEASRVLSLQSRFEHELRSLKNLPASDPAVRYPEWHEIPVLSEQEQRRREDQKRKILEQTAALSESKSSRLYLWLYNMLQRSENVGLRQGSRLPLSCEPLQCQVTMLWFRRGSHINMPLIASFCTSIEDPKKCRSNTNLSRVWWMY